MPTDERRPPSPTDAITGDAGARLIAAERKRQITSEHWDAAHDDDHNDDELAWAAVCYAAPEPVFCQVQRAKAVEFVDPFPWREDDDRRPHNGNTLKKPTEKQRLRLLVKAGALVAAEIDRLLRRGVQFDG